MSESVMKIIVPKSELFRTILAAVLCVFLWVGMVVAQAPIQYGSVGSVSGAVGGSGYSAASGPANIVVPQPVTPTPTLPGVAPSTPTLLSPFDPYATPNQSSLFPNTANSPVVGGIAGSGATPVGTTNGQGGVYSGSFDRFVPETYEAMRRFRDLTSVEYTYLPGGKASDAFGLGEIDMSMQLAIPCRFIPTANGAQGYFFVAPGGGLVWWDGPAGPPHMSANGFKAYVDIGAQPQITEVFGLNAWARLGIFSDFEDVSSDAFRLQGRLEGVFNISPQMKLYAGVIYMDRERIKIMPTGGIVWTPRDDLVVKLLFPNPKISKRLWTGTKADWWGYLHADYAGDSWDIKGLGQTDYNDIRVGLGLEFETLTRVGGYFEFGGSFGRELYSNHQKWASPPDVLYLKTGFIF